MFRRSAFVIGLTLFCSAAATAQTNTGVSGHWEGAVQYPNGDIPLTLDLTVSDGRLGGTLSAPGLVDLPLMDIAVNGKTVTFGVRRDQAFSGMLTPDGKSIQGDSTLGTFSLPFTLTRTGEVKVAPRTPTPAVGKQFEGRWTGTLDLGAMQFRLALHLANNPDGTSTGSVVNLDQGQLTLPVTSIIENGSMLTLGFKAVDATYSATLSADQTTLVGTYMQGRPVPVTFKRETTGP